MRRNLTRFSDFSAIDLLILNELNGENLAKRVIFLFSYFSRFHAVKMRGLDRAIESRTRRRRAGVRAIRKPQGSLRLGALATRVCDRMLACWQHMRPV
jgi:hypothetical protein